MKKNKKENQSSVLINFILDQSGSMETIKRQTISGFNEYLQGLKNQDGDIRMSLTLFETGNIEKRYVTTPVHKIEELTTNTYKPNGGTPLYDAVVETVEKAYEMVSEMKKEPGCIVVIMTDGEENASRYHTETCLKDLKQKLEKKGNWSFIFMGANQDAWATANKLGFSQGNTMQWEASAEGTIRSYRSLAQATANYSADNAKGVMNTSNFFKKEENNVT